MKRISIILIMIISACIVGCVDKEEKNESTSKKAGKATGNKILAENYTDVAGNITWLNVFDYSPLFDEVYEWTKGVKLPIAKPENVNIELTDMYLRITEYEVYEFEKYVEGLQDSGYALRKYQEKDETRQWLDYVHYVVYKDNLLILFEEIENYINVFVTSGNVVGERSVSVPEVRKMLGDEHTDSIILEIAYESVYASGYCEFIVIPPEVFYLTADRPEPFYVIANSDGVMLCESGMWNETYPMSVVLCQEDNKKLLYVNQNDMAGLRSGADIYPMLVRYELKDGKFVEIDRTNLQQDKIVIGRLEDKTIKYYEMQINDDFNLINGRKNYWKISGEYASVSNE